MFKKNRKYKAKSPLLSTGDIVTKFLSFVALAATVSVLPVQAQNISIDGNTNTIIQNNGSITNISTSTIHNTTAFNSFKSFNISESEIVNLLLPGSTSTLVNLIKQGPSNINGTLNSIMNGKPGGNIFLVNPYGIIVGNTGVINVGSLVVATPTANFVDTFFDAPGMVNLQSLNSLEEGSFTVNPNARFENHGVIQALDSVKITAGSVINEGEITTGYIAEGKVNFNDLINTADLEDGNYIVAKDSNISIKANSDITNSGLIAAYSTDKSENNFVHLKADNDINLLAGSELKAKGLLENASGGDVIVLAGNDSLFEQGSVINASAGKGSGNAGFIELSADNTVYAFGQFKASAKNGKAGTIFIDPDEVITNNVFTDGAAFIVNADNITVQGVIISTRDIADPIGGDHLLDPSEGDSGQLNLNAFDTIDIQPGTAIYTFADNGFNSPLAEFIGDTINLDNAELILGETRFNSSNINLSNQTVVASDSNALFTLVGSALMTMDNSLINTSNGIMIGGNDAALTINDSTLFAEGSNGVDVQVDTLTINTTTRDSNLWSLDGDINVSADTFRVNPAPDTEVTFLAMNDVSIQSNDLIFDALRDDNNSVIVEAGNDATFKTSPYGLLDLYVTDINAGNGIIFDASEGGVTILDSFWHSGGEKGIDISAMYFAFVGDQANASMLTDAGGVKINAFQTIFEADTGTVEVEVNGEQSNFELNGFALGIGAVENDLSITVNDGNIIFDQQFGTLIVTENANALTLNASNNIEINSNFLTMIGEFTSGNDVNMIMVDFEESLIADSTFNVGRDFVINAPDTLLTISSTNIDAKTISITADKLAIDADLTESVLNVSGDSAFFIANELVFASTEANLTLNVPNGLVGFLSPDITFEIPQTGNDITINAEDAFFFGDSIAFSDPGASLTPGSVFINLTEDFIMDNRLLPPMAMAFPTSVNSQITDSVTQSNLIINDIFLQNTEINANSILFSANSNVQLENSRLDAMDGIFFEVESSQVEVDSTIVAVDTDLIARGMGGIVLNTQGLFVSTESRDVTFSSEASSILIDSDFTNIFGNLAGSGVDLTAKNDIIFVGDHTNIGMNILNPFENDFTININAGGTFSVADFQATTLMMNNVDLIAGAIDIQSNSGVAMIQDSCIQANGPSGIFIDVVELGILSDLKDTNLTTTTGNIGLFSDTNISVLNSFNNTYTSIHSGSSLDIVASGTGQDEGIIEIVLTDIDAAGSIDFSASQKLLIYGESTVDSSAAIEITTPQSFLGCSELPGELPGTHIESPIFLTITTDDLTVDPSSATLIGANGSLNVTRLTQGNLYYGDGEPVDFLNITPNELNNMWSSFVVLGNLPGENELTDNIFLHAPLGVPNGITLYSNNSIPMWPGSSIWAFSTVMNSNTITIQDGVTINSEIIDLTADNFNISTAIGTAVTGNSEVRIDRQTPGDFIISDTGNLKGLNSVSATSNLMRKVSLGLNSSNVENVEFGQAVNMPCLFEINAQGSVTDTLNTEDPNITSEGLTIKANSIGTEDEDFNFSLTSGFLSLDLLGDAYLNSTNNDVVIDSVNLFDAVTGELFDLVLQTTNGGIFQTPNILEIIANNAHLFADGDVNLDINAQDMVEVMGNNVILSAQGNFVDVLANNTLTATDISGNMVWLFAGDNSTFTNVIANVLLLSQVDGQLNIDNLDSGMTGITTADNLTLTNATINGLFALESDNNATVQGQFNDSIQANVANTLNIDNSALTKIAFIEAADVLITSQGSVLDNLDTEDPNIIAQNIDLTSVNGTIGSPTDDLNATLTASRLDANASGSVNIKATGDFELGNVISQNSNVRLEADNAFIMADNGVIRGNHIAVLANEIQVSENTVIEGTANVGFATDSFTVSTPVSPAIKAGGAIVLSRYSKGGMIIQDDGIQDANSRAPMHLDLDAFVSNELVIGNHALTNSNTDTIFVNDQLIYDKNKLTLSVNNLIYDKNDNLPSVVADNLTLISGGNIGLKDNFFDANIENTLQANANGSIYLKDHNKNMVIDTIEDKDGSIYLSTATGNIYIGTINTLKQIIITAGGQIVSIDHLDPEDVIISVGDPSGTITINDGSVSNSVDLKANTINANFTDTGSTGVSFDLSNINNTRADLVNLIANSSNGMTFNKLFAVNSVIRNNTAGGSLIFNNADVSGALTVSADNISTPNRVSVQNASLTGINGNMADSIQFMSSDSLKIDKLRANKTHIGTSGDILDIRNARVYDSGYFSNSTKRVVLDNVGTFRDYSSVDAIFFTRDIFDLYLDGSPNIKTTADILFIRPDISVNGTRNGDEAGKVLALTTHQAYSYMDNAENNTFYKDYTSDFFYNDYINVFAFVMADSYSDEQNFGVTNYLLNKAIAAYREALSNNNSEIKALEMAIDVLEQANMTKQVAQELLNNPVYETEPNSQKILDYYISN